MLVEIGHGVGHWVRWIESIGVVGNSFEVDLSVGVGWEAATSTSCLRPLGVGGASLGFGRWFLQLLVA